MDNKKIGKLIASLRKQNNLTQQELGDKVGVGFRAVSKWERGINLPDIGIINDVSKILGITTDELLKGEVKKENNPKTKKKLPLSIKITISVIIFLLISIPLTYLYFSNKTYTYNLVSANREEYHIEGQMTFKKDNFSIIINQIGLLDEEFNSDTIRNYEYEITSEDNSLYKYGFIPTGNTSESKMTMLETVEQISINYSSQTELKRKEIVNNNIKLIIKFVSDDGDEIIKELDILLYPKRKS